ncbi:MAG: hypothetical protein CR993_00325 [Rhodobacterales bacterium]|nr:MAG: hypothetical protein CR993_00325 [Rhodobacterales bacterium]
MCKSCADGGLIFGPVRTCFCVAAVENVWLWGCGEKKDSHIALYLLNNQRFKGFAVFENAQVS